MIIRFLRKIYRRLFGKDLYVRTTIRKNKVWYGSEYGGFYVCPDKLTDKSIVYSFGIGEDVTFDLEIIKQHKCSVYGFDPTPKSIKWISQQIVPSQFTFLPYGIASQSGLVDFYLPSNEDYVSGSIMKNKVVNENRRIKVPMKTFAEVVEGLQHKRIAILKMDIEGAEYEVLPSILDSNVPIDQIVVEFHHRMVENGFNKTKHIIKLIKNKGYAIFAVSDCAEEISFLKSNNLKNKS